MVERPLVAPGQKRMPAPDFRPDWATAPATASVMSWVSALPRVWSESFFVTTMAAPSVSLRHDEGAGDLGLLGAHGLPLRLFEGPVDVVQAVLVGHNLVEGVLVARP